MSFLSAAASRPFHLHSGVQTWPRTIGKDEMIRTMIAALAAVGIGTAAAAAECDQDEARARLDTARASGAIQDMGFYNEMVTLTVLGPVWEGLGLNARIGMFMTLECALFGEGSVLREAQVIDGRGVQMAVWDGIHQSIDAKR